MKLSPAPCEINDFGEDISIIRPRKNSNKTNISSIFLYKIHTEHFFSALVLNILPENSLNEAGSLWCLVNLTEKQAEIYSKHYPIEKL